MKLLIYFLLLLNFHFAFSQQDSIVQSEPESKSVRYDENSNISPLKFEKTTIENLKQNEDFNYLEEEQHKNWWQQFKEWINQKYEQFLNWLFGDYDAGSFFGLIIKIIPYILLVGIVILVIWLFTRINPGKNILQEPKAANVNLDNEEEIIQNADIPALIKEAIENGQYRMAVRYYYLQALKELDLKNVIDFEAQKTNDDYISEISNTQLNNIFKKVTRIYNFIWYGDFQVSKEDFLLAEKGFSELNTNIKNTKNE
ncbi:DUF4129 domain-containing protein [Zunongwangia sp. HRR-M8]|uniref:DUF4129 domain-containing protein n=1 Tax=Zunongwangia sp. HRR-M8 TaxID=3015170 RepID=UPI0022DE5A07|nr:DUF4129 domain-containing protein [Zunongwangia sp. HRR-M8]WBL21032.1 DUF4129 domain-containing protein [Zunongwangia sp. HRR-M8]